MTPAHPLDRPGRILLVVAHRVRDLEGQALLAFHLERRGHRTELCIPDDLVDRVLDGAPDVLVLDDLGWSGRAEVVRLARQLGIRVVVVPVAGLFEADDELLRAAGGATGAAPLIDAYCCWGVATAETLIASGTLTREQVTITGCPRFDLYSAPYLALMRSRSDLLQQLGLPDDRRPLILWATNTPHFARGAAAEIRNKVRRGLVPYRYALEQIEEEASQFREHSRAVTELARRQPDWSFVIKVHPLEPLELYRPLVDRAPNLRLAFDAPIREFIRHCDVLLQRGCTTAAEAWMLGKPVLELGIGSFRRQWAPTAYLDGNHRVSTIDGAVAAIAGYLAGAPIPADQRRARDDYARQFYHRLDGGAAERCADVIHQVVAAAREQDRTGSSRRAAAAAERARREAHQDRRPVNRIKDLVGIPRRQSLRFWRGWSRALGGGRPVITRAERGFKPEVVAALFDRYAAVVDGARRDAEARGA